jgi:hypothetical protein
MGASYGRTKSSTAKMMLSSPVWIVALVLAAGAPWFVRVLADRLELRVRKRTEELIARARRIPALPIPARPTAAQGVDPTGPQEEAGASQG